MVLQVDLDLFVIFGFVEFEIEWQVLGGVVVVFFEGWFVYVVVYGVVDQMIGELVDFEMMFFCFVLFFKFVIVIVVLCFVECGEFDFYVLLNNDDFLLCFDLWLILVYLLIYIGGFEDKFLCCLQCDLGNLFDLCLYFEQDMFCVSYFFGIVLIYLNYGMVFVGFVVVDVVDCFFFDVVEVFVFEFFGMC